MTPTLTRVALAAWLLAATAQAADPDLRWFTFSSEHFHVHYHDDGEAFARRTAAVAEDALDRLGQALGWRPAQDRVHLVVHDQSDGANGFARVQPFDAITVLAFGPEADTDLTYYDDWLRLLVTHELTHVLHLDQAGGVPSWINAVFGKTLLPNLALPNWFVEGLATVVESRYTDGGRLGSASYDMYLRSAVLGSTLPTTLGGLTGSPIERPQGTWDYAFGSSFLGWIADRHGIGSLVDFAERYGRRLIPYGVNNVARAAFGRDFESMFEDWRRDLVAEARSVEASVRSAGLIEGRRLTTEGWTHHAPAWSLDGRMAVMKNNGHEPGFMHLGHFDDQGALVLERLYRCRGGCGRPAFAPDGETLFAIGGRWADAHRFSRELLRYDLRSRPRQPTRLTRGLRARELDVHPDGRRIAFVGARWGRTAVLEHDLKTSRTRALIPFDRGLQLNQPRYLARGRLAVSAQGSGGFRDLYIREADGRLVRITDTPDREIGLSAARDGSALFFSSDRGGIWNIHRLDLETFERRQVTRVLGGAFNPSISPDGRRLLYNGYHAGGHDLYRVDLGPTETLAHPPRPDVARKDTPWSPPPVAGVVRGYRGYRSAWPRTWAPVFQIDTLGVSGLGVELSGQDAIGHHFWSLGVDFQMRRLDASLAASYGYFGWRPSVHVSLARFPGSGFRFVADEWQEFDREQLFASGGISVGLPHFEHPFSLNVGGSVYAAFERDPDTDLGHDPGSFEPFVPRDVVELSLDVGWSYNHVERYPLAISPSEGWRCGMTFSLVPAWLGNPDDSWALTWHLDGYLPLPWAKAHVLALKTEGGLSGGDSPRTFSVGGFPQQDVALDLLNEVGLFGAYLRGFQPGAFSGSVYHQATAEYRLPLAKLFWAPGTLPIWLKRLNAAVFADGALTWDEELVLDSALHGSAGAELSLTLDLFYDISYTMRLGYARALTDPFGDQVYFVLGSNL